MAWMLDALKNKRDIVPVRRPTAERDVAATEDLDLSDGCGSFIRLVSNFNIALQAQIPHRHRKPTVKDSQLPCRVIDTGRARVIKGQRKPAAR